MPCFSQGAIAWRQNPQCPRLGQPGPGHAGALGLIARQPGLALATVYQPSQENANGQNK